jgi:hypothetical protein
MKLRLPDFVQHRGLNDVRLRMGADLIEYVAAGTSRRISLRDLQQLSTTGLQIDPADIETLQDGTFTYQGERVLLYIFQPYKTPPRYHLCNCRTWDDMKAKGRQDRYVASRRTDGLFEIDMTATDGSVTHRTEHLDVCQNCLSHLRWKGFAFDLTSKDRLKMVREFSLDAFFEERRQSMIREKPQWTPETIPSASYTDDFDDVSSAARAAAKWRCFGCSRLFALAWQRRYLHTHHANGIKGDNRPENLRVVCLGCHAKQPHHDRMKYSPDYHKFIQLFGTS